MNVRRWIAAAAVVSMAVAGCGDDDDDSSTSATAEVASDEGAAFVDAIEASLAAENAGDADAFLALWTDKGLEEYDSGTREEIAAGDSGLGEEEIEIVDIGEPEVEGDTATVRVDATVGEASFVRPIFRVGFTGIKDGDAWKLDGFEFRGSPPPSDDAAVVEVTALDYEFHLDRDAVPAGEVAFRFVNDGAEQHEVTFYKAPDGVSVEEATAALADVDGGELEDIPDGYEVAHIGFADVGQPAADITFADPLAGGTYVLACYIPQGGFGEEGPVNPDGRPHIQLGMIHLLTVE